LLDALISVEKFKMKTKGDAEKSSIAFFRRAGTRLGTKLGTTTAAKQNLRTTAETTTAPTNDAMPPPTDQP